MKKSEVLDMLECILATNSFNNTKTLRDLSQEILDSLLDVGMLPVKRTYEQSYDAFGIDNVSSYTCVDNTWEPENE